MKKKECVRRDGERMDKCERIRVGTGRGGIEEH
jgi:hypothetical protein